MKRFAVIDLGTNTFHLLIAGRKSEKEFIEIYRERIYVKLGQEGIDTLSQSALRRAVDAMKKIKQIIGLFEAIEVRAFATAAFRTATNADVLIQRIQREFEIQVEIITGEEEARIIYEGVKYSGALQRDENIVMDIGGGSVEFMLGTKEQLNWCISLPIGVSLLKNKFHHTEPISKMELCEMRLYLKKALQPLAEKIKGETFNTLIGSSGTFDVLSHAIKPVERLVNCDVLSTKDFTDFQSAIIQMTYKERVAHPAIPENRADLIVVAMVLLDEVLMLNPAFQYIIISPYALKEGMVMEMIAAYLV